MKTNLFIGLLLIAAALAGAYFITSQPLTTQKLAAAGAQAYTTTGVTPALGTRIKQVNCQSHGALADSDCTPGAIIPTASKQAICVAGYSQSVRNVPASEKRAVYDEYGIVSHTTGQYEVDHLVSLELGGSNDIANLWPEPASPSPGFHQKDVVENYLHNQVCSGAMPLDVAQRSIASNWLNIYQAIPH